MKYSIGIIGDGFVGSAIKAYYQEALVYDKFKDSDSLEEVLTSDIIFLAVPTPYNKLGFDKQALEESFKSIGKTVTDKIVVIKSTVQPGTSEYFQNKYPNLSILFNPEFLDQVHAEKDFKKPNRQIVGYTQKSKKDADKLLGMLPDAPFKKTIPAKEAEMVKYFNNAFYATKVIFANEIYDVCKKAGVEYDYIKECVSADPRIGPSHLEIVHKGYRGYGGACLPKDVRSLIQYGETMGKEMKLLKKVEQLNNALRQERTKRGE